jgi:hypothetical protein
MTDDSHQGDEPGVPDTDPDAYLEELGIDVDDIL